MVLEVPTLCHRQCVCNINYNLSFNADTNSALTLNLSNYPWMTRVRAAARVKLVYSTKPAHVVDGVVIAFS